MRILHGADFHLDSPFHSLPPEKAKERRRESRELLEDLAACAGTCLLARQNRRPQGERA